MIYLTVRETDWFVQNTKAKHLVHHQPVVESQPETKNLAEVFRLHNGLAWVLRGLSDDGYDVKNHELSVSVSSKLNPFFTNKAVPQSAAGAELVGKCRMILQRFKRFEMA